jgi:hypothetical protein
VPTIEISQFESEIVLHFSTLEPRINAYTLATTLISVADAAREANNLVNPGYEIEVDVVALTNGSFKAVLKTLYKDLKNLFSKETLKAIIIGIISTYIYEHALAPNRDVKVVVDQNTVIVEQGDTKIVIPKDIYEAKQLVEKSDRFRASMSKTFTTIGKDAGVDGLGLASSISSEPSVTIPRQVFQAIEAVPGPESENREIIQHAKLQIMRAILDKSTRKWEFVWEGITLSAPVLDDAFYKDFYDHRITVAPGDSLECDVKMYQRLTGPSGVYINYKYEVVKVTKHIPKVETKQLFETKP